LRYCAIVPSHDHHAAIGRVVAQLREAGLPVFVIDDGSGEPARSVIAALHDEKNAILVTRLEPNRGKGTAVIRGFELASPTPSRSMRMGNMISMLCPGCWRRRGIIPKP